ncbi:MAG TPA: ComF family protein [Firmicutes bacterium]|nr:ComF family protein [Bacillota bacterium]
MIFKDFFSLLLNRYCACCGEGLSFRERKVCFACLNRVSKFTSAVCRKCGRPEEGYSFKTEGICRSCIVKKYNYSELYAFGPYSGILKDILIKFKFKNRSELSELLTGFLLSDPRFLHFIEGFNIFIPVPLSAKRLNYRGYNQVYLILRRLKSRFADITVLRNAVIRVRETEFQKNLKRTERKKNIINAFKVRNPGLIAGKRVIVFDDIYTTGATVNEVSRLLKAAGALEVKVAVIAR